MKFSPSDESRFDGMFSFVEICVGQLMQFIVVIQDTGVCAISCALYVGAICALCT